MPSQQVEPPPRASERSRLVRVNTSDVVAEKILERVVAGKLRPGDRIDLDSIAAELGVSRAPVREALRILQRDGVVDLPYHRGAFVARFDASTVHEAFELCALLNAMTTARVARSRQPEVLADLSLATDEVRAASGANEMELASREFRRIINVAADSPHLRALLRTFGGLVPVASRLAVEGRLDDERDLVVAENEAIQNGRVEEACAITIDHMRLLGDCAVRRLRSTGVIGDDEQVAPDPDLAILFAAIRGKAN